MCFLKSNQCSFDILEILVLAAASCAAAPSDACRSQICVANRVGPNTGNSMQEVMALVSESSTQSSKVGHVNFRVNMCLVNGQIILSEIVCLKKLHDFSSPRLTTGDAKLGSILWREDNVPLTEIAGSTLLVYLQCSTQLSIISGFLLAKVVLMPCFKMILRRVEMKFAGLVCNA